ncbi:MAG: hypothetical protein IPK52_22160 [Chloroflexi bacterium]|nr:hypothetical protein [Chloroflexota bacterium]
MYDLADGYDSWLDRLDALADERTEPEPTPTQVADFFNALFEQDNIDALRGMATMIQRMADEDAERTGVASPQPSHGRAYVRPADHAARLQQTVARIAAAPRYAHRSHRHQRGEE